MLDKTRKAPFRIRGDEQDYAYVPMAESPELNRYGKPIQLVGQGDPLAGQSLHINDSDTVSDNPNRYKQHGFYFNADNCIACHACESACSEKNNLPPHLAFRSVGYVEGGSYPAYTRLNISMACNHCDDPVCLKGCPTRAYTKFAEYGAVLQDPDICFGCGYCTWVCPYNAPQLDPVKGQVEKCNMCIDRLEVGLKPACASACLAGALDFGVIETLPDNREQLETRIPGFPSPEITQPNIRFQQKKSLPREMTRPDVMPLRYERDGQGKGPFRTKVANLLQGRQWNLRKLRSREDPLVVFTLLSQAVIGAFGLMFAAPLLGITALSGQAHPLAYTLVLFALLAIETFALVLSTLHLGKPHRFYRAFNNLRYSPVSREVASLAVFYNLLLGYAVFTAWPGFMWLPESLTLPLRGLLGWGALLAGPVALYFMHRIYRIKARPYWDHWQVLSAFYGNMLSLGALLAGAVFVPLELYAGRGVSSLLQLLGAVAFTGLALEAIGLWRHARAMLAAGGEGAVSYALQCSHYGKTRLLRNASLGIAMLSAATLLIPALPQAAALGVATILLLAGLVSALLGRAMFYVLVIPTTMPGAFFWRNRGFQEHARETGLANMPQTGVVPDGH